MRINQILYSSIKNAVQENFISVKKDFQFPISSIKRITAVKIRILMLTPVRKKLCNKMFLVESKENLSV